MNISKEKGFSLIELSIVMAIFAITMASTIPVIKNAITQQKTFESKAEVKSHQRILEKVMQKALIAVRPEHFNKSETYVFDTNIVSSTDPMGLNGKIIPPFEEQLTVDFSSSGSEGGSFVDGAISVPSTIYPMQLNSFTLGVMKVGVDPSTKKLEGTLSRLLAARCIQNGQAMEGDGRTIDNSAPIKSTMRVMSENRYPFIKATGNKLEVRCCLINQTNCNRTYPQFVPKIYSITLKDNIPQSIMEFPGSGSRESMGSGFLITFNQQNNANYFRTIFFDLENTCELTLSGGKTCGNNNPGMHLANAGVLKLDSQQLRQNIRTRSFIRFGRVKKGFETSGVIVLGE